MSIFDSHVNLQDRRVEPRVASESSMARFLRLIRFSHTVFALPFALAALVVSANGRPSLKVVVLVLGCMITARTAAMLFNRFVDWEIDQRNPRTGGRHLLATRNIIFIW